MLLTGLDSDLHIIRESLEQNDHEALLERVHRLHGACRYCGVPQLEESRYRGADVTFQNRYQFIQSGGALFADYNHSRPAYIHR